MKLMRRNMGRSYCYYTSLRILALALLILPALLYGCSSSALVNPAEEISEDGTEIEISSPCPIASTDIFIFNDDAVRRLDSYQRIDGQFTVENVRIASRTGKKIIVAVANSHLTKAEWARVNSYEGLNEIMACLEYEDPEFPLMSGEVRTDAGNAGRCRIDLRPLMSEICIRSLKCDFSETGYDGEVLEDVKIYLTNVCSSCQMICNDSFLPKSICNFGGLNADDMRRFEHPEMLFKSITEIPLDTDVKLFCYPNESEEESAGSPFTRLVIEGRLRSKTYYYPININRDEATNGRGIGRNSQYVYDITIRRSGCDDPDTPVDASTVVAACKTAPWRETENVSITFGAKSGFVTKSNDPQEDLITDINLFVFNSEGIMEKCIYKKSNDLENIGNEYSIDVSLLKGCRYSFYACANIGYPLTFNDISEMEDYRYFMTYPDEYKAGIPMSGAINDVTIKGGESIEILLERAMAKVSVRIDRSRLNPDVEFRITGIKAVGSPKFVRMFGYSHIAKEDDAFANGFSKYDEQTQELNISRDKMISGEVSIYLLENRQGNQLEGIDSYKDKVFDSGDSREKICSSIELKAEYLSPSHYTYPGRNLTYRFYLGESPENFDVIRNSHYHITVIPEGDGLSEDSWRIDKSGIGTYINKITLSYMTYSLTWKGENVPIVAHVEPDDADHESIIWESSNKAIASVSSDGVVTANGEGKCTIVCHAADGSDVKAECAINVSFLPYYLKLSTGNYIRGKVGDSIHIRCDVFPPDTPLDLGIDELETDKERGIYDYTIDDDGKGVTLYLKNSGRGILYVEAGEPVNDSELIVVEVDLQTTDS